MKSMLWPTRCTGIAWKGVAGVATGGHWSMLPKAVQAQVDAPKVASRLLLLNDRPRSGRLTLVTRL